jgi:hypothetical protein
MLFITQKQAKRRRPKRKRSLKICVDVACCFARYGADALMRGYIELPVVLVCSRSILTKRGA